MLTEEAQITADKDAILRDLRFMTARWHEIGQPAKIELRAFAEDKQPQWAQFSLDWMDEAADWALSMNQRGRNVYVVRNPVREDVSGSAKDTDILGSFFLWADCDEPASTENVRRFDGPRWTASVVTGTIPHQRVHVYWELEDFCQNLDAWRETQVAISRHFASDGVVVNPSRIMRLGGTVVYPDSKKQAKGYISEVSTIRTEWKEERAPVDMMQMRRVFAASTPAKPASDFAIDTGPQPLDRERMAIQALEGKEWHNAVIRLVGSYVSKGLSDTEIHSLTDPLTLPGYTVEQTRREVQTAIDGARRKGWTPEAQPEPPPPPADPEQVFRPWKVISPLEIPRRDFLYGHHYIRKFASVTVAPGGVGKSTLVLIEALAMATGRDLLGVLPPQKFKVVYYNAEDPIDEINRRVVAACQHFDIPQQELVGQFYTASGREHDVILAHGDEGKIHDAAFDMIEGYGRQIGMDVFIADPLANMTESPETNDVFRRLGKRLSKLADDLNASIEIVHHTRKLNGKEAEIEDSRGGSALIGAVRAGRALNPMSKDEAAKAGLETHIDHFRIEPAGKNNLARSPERAIWFEKKSVELANGDYVAVAQSWEWPDAFKGLTEQDAADVRRAVMACDPAPKRNVQAREWVGYIVAEVLGLPSESKGEKAHITALINGWIKSDVLREERHKSARDGRETPVVVAGDNNPEVV